MLSAKNGVDKIAKYDTVKTGCPPLRAMSERRTGEVPRLVSTTSPHVLMYVNFTALFQNTTADILL